MPQTAAVFSQGNRIKFVIRYDVITTAGHLVTYYCNWQKKDYFLCGEEKLNQEILHISLIFINFIVYKEPRNQ